METLKKKLASGADLEIFLSTFQEGHNLFMAVTKELKDTDFAGVTVGKLSMDILSSAEIMSALWPCLGKSLYTGAGYQKQKINPDIFEKAEVRNDFLEIVEEVLIYNILPFSKKIGLLLKTTFLNGIDPQALK